LSARIAWRRGGNADCDFQPRRRQKRIESGLSEGQFEFKVLHHYRNQEPNQISPKDGGLRAD
jgi:hypothetical protein